MKKSIFVLLSALLALMACNPDNKEDVKDKGDDPQTVLTKCPFTKGVNLANWFQQSAEKYLTKNTYTEKDFKDLVNLGFEAIRLPISFHKFTGPAPDYKLSDNFFQILDYAVDQAEANGLYIILDNHTYFGQDEFPVQYGEEQLTRVWEQMASRYKDRSELVIYEVMNEPGGAYMEEHWYEIQTRFLQTIRAIDNTHTVIVKGVGDGVGALGDIPVYDDSNLIYSFHLYAPHLFTHQGATWGNSPTVDLEKPVPFPYDKESMPAMPASFNGTDYKEMYEKYPEQGNAEYVKSRIDSAVVFAAERGVPVFCGEFGVLRAMADNDDRCEWHKLVVDYLELSMIGWTVWDYKTDFALFETSGNIFEQDLNVKLVEALGLTVPPSYSSDLAPELQIYDDVLANYAKNSSWNGKGSETDSYYCVNYECTRSPYEGAKCIEWAIPTKEMEKTNYCTLSFTFWPVVDFTPQVESDYNLEFMIRCEDVVDKMYVRFTYYRNKTTRAWRNVYEMGNNHPFAYFASDGAWHKVSIPLSYFWIKGNNDADKWVDNYDEYIKENPDQAWDWEHINKLEFATENNANLKGITIFIDDVRICKSTK